MRKESKVFTALNLAFKIATLHAYQEIPFGIHYIEFDIKRSKYQLCCHLYNLLRKYFQRK